MEIHCKERMAACLKMAREHNDDSLREILHQLLNSELNAYENGCIKTVHIYTDFDKNSFEFREVYDGTRIGITGGIIFHGYDDEPDNSGAVCIDGPARGYRIHT